MIEPSVALQKGIFAALNTSAHVIEAFSSLGKTKRIYDRVPTNQGVVAPNLYPYIQIGGDTVEDVGNACVDMAESYVDIHVWSLAVGQLEAKALSAAVTRALDDAIEIEGHGVVVFAIDDIRNIPNPDGLTTHRVVTVRYVTTPA